MTDVTGPGEPAIEAPEPQPYLQELVVSSLFFAIFLALTKAAVHFGWVLPQRLPGGLTGFAAFSAISFGLTIILVFSVVAWPFRRLAGAVPVIGPHLYTPSEPEPEGLLSCALCTGTWVGGLLAVLGVSVFPVTHWYDILVHGWLAAGVCWVLYGVTSKLGIN